MSALNHGDGPRPAWRPAVPQAMPPAESWDEGPEAEAPAARPFGLKVVWRAARRYWWQILLLWGVGSVGLMALAYHKIKTSYTATALLNVRSSAPRVFGGDGQNDRADFARYQKTQVDLVTSPDVLNAALVRHPELGGLPLLRQADGAEDRAAAVRRAIRVLDRSDTSLITVEMASEDPREASQFVDAVVESYLLAANTWSDREAREQIKRLQEEARKLESQIEAQKDELRKLTARLGTVDTEGLKNQGLMSLDRFKGYLATWDAARIERIRLESELEGARMRAGRAAAPAAPILGQEELSRRIASHPAMAPLIAERDRARRTRDAASRLARKGHDPAVVNAERLVQDLEGRIQSLARDLAAEVQREASARPPAADGPEEALQDLDARLAAARNTEEGLQKAIDAMKVDQKATGGDVLEVELSKAKLDQDEKLLLSIKNYITQMEFEASGPSQVERANEKNLIEPSANKRLKVMAAAPIGMLGLVLGLFVLVEVRSGRVADPDELPARARVEVVGVVPPLPSLRPTRALPGGRGESKARRQLEEFVQSLDHLRVALCSGRGAGGRRCVLITSACSSEGKTTLSAHLAGRCANAGLSTLLIDADLRNPSLSRLLKVPDGPGLSDVLRGEAAAESALTVIEAGGGFHLMPAGTPGYDPSRLLQDDRLGQLIGQFRQAFDIILLDTPPVLLVADALTLGRWADGALLAVRYDTSRFPLVERAHRRLAAVGVPVFGAVVNGVRTMDSSYGYYSYAYQAEGSRAPSATIDVPAEPTA